ncbi:MAG: TatD family hydrolase [Bifidobacteriaceae bacterium]|jgi:TatD DNase family protein|nr:TatD family hydrolase [Bifidobacteriaceae bacterium]
MNAVAKDRTYPPIPEALPVPIFDNHAHIEPFQRFPAEALPLDQQVEAAAKAGVQGIVQCGCDLEAAEWTAQVAVRHPAVLGVIALHPNDSVRLKAAGTYGDALARIAELAAGEERIRGIGETGLDYFRTGPDGWAAQREAFLDHIALAKELGLALQIHDRDAHADVIATLEEVGAPERTVFHSFSGDAAMARLAAERGWYCSFSGTVTFKNAAGLREAAAALPPELVLVETDSPYLTPEPCRGRPNAPYMVAQTMRTVANCINMPLADACAQIQSNTLRVYGEL